MSEDGQDSVGVPAFVDFMANMINIPGGKKPVEDFLRRRFESKMSSMIEKIQALGPALVPMDGYLRYLLEARDLFVQGFDYGAVALCGMVADVVTIQIAEQRVSGKDKQDLLDSNYKSRVEKLGDLNRFRSQRSKGALEEIGNIRREYVHLRRPQPVPKEVERAFQLLRLVIFAEFGLVPGEGGKAVPTRPEDIEGLAKELGIA